MLQLWLSMWPACRKGCSSLVQEIVNFKFVFQTLIRNCALFFWPLDPLQLFLQPKYLFLMFRSRLPVCVSPYVPITVSLRTTLLSYKLPHLLTVHQSTHLLPLHIGLFICRLELVWTSLYRVR